MITLLRIKSVGCDLYIKQLKFVNVMYKSLKKIVGAVSKKLLSLYKFGVEMR